MDYWNMITSVATAVGVAIAAWQLWESRKLAASAFEDSFDEKYRQLAFSIPVDALLSKKIPLGKRTIAREGVYNYLDLSNEQIYLRKQKRVSYDRWVEWSKGMQLHLQRPFFREVLDEVENDSFETFSYLEKLIEEDFQTDPVKW